MLKNPPANAGYVGDVGSVSGSGRSPGGGNENPLQYSCLENFMDRRVWQAMVYGVAKSQTCLMTEHKHFLDLSLDLFICLNKVFKNSLELSLNDFLCYLLYFISSIKNSFLQRIHRVHKAAKQVPDTINSQEILVY